MFVFLFWTVLLCASCFAFGILLGLGSLGYFDAFCCDIFFFLGASLLVIVLFKCFAMYVVPSFYVWMPYSPVQDGIDVFWYLQCDRSKRTRSLQETPKLL